MSVKDLDFTGVEEALEDGEYQLAVNSTRPLGISAKIYNPDSNGRPIAKGSSLQESRRLPDDALSKKVRGPPSLPVAIARASADYADGSEPADVVERPDAVTDWMFENVTTTIDGFYDHDQYVLDINGTDYRSEGADLTDAYENLQLELAEDV